MLRSLIRWISPLAWSLFSCSLLIAQDAKEKTESAPSTVPQFALALLGTIIVMVVICKPTRKDW